MSHSDMAIAGYVASVPGTMMIRNPNKGLVLTSTVAKWHHVSLTSSPAYEYLKWVVNIPCEYTVKLFLHAFYVAKNVLSWQN